MNLRQWWRNRTWPRCPVCERQVRSLHKADGRYCGDWCRSWWGSPKVPEVACVACMSKAVTLWEAEYRKERDRVYEERRHKAEWEVVRDDKLRQESLAHEHRNMVRQMVAGLLANPDLEITEPKQVVGWAESVVAAIEEAEQ